MKERYIRHIFVTTMIMSIAIFLSGFLLGWVLDSYRTDEIMDIIRQNDLNSESYTLEQNFLAMMGDENIDCEVINPRIETMSLELGKTGQELQRYSSTSDFKEEDYEYLRRRYFLLEIKFYNTLKRQQSLCENSYTPILYFYRTDDKTSELQGYVLDEFVKDYNDDAKDKNTHGQVVVLSIDGEYDKDPIILTIMKTYGIESGDLPALVIGFNQTHKGFTGKPELEEIFSMAA